MYIKIEIEKLVAASHQARKDFDEEALKNLAESMKQVGLLEPILVREEKDGRYELISGERRWRAAKMLQWDKIDARVIETASEADAAVKGMVENLQREDLNPIEEAEGFQTLNQLDRKYWTLKRIGEVAGRSESFVSRSAELLNLPEEIKENLRARKFSRSHGLELARLSSVEQQLEVARKIPGHLTWEETRDLVNQLLGHKGKKKRDAEPTAADYIASQGFRFAEKGKYLQIRADWDRSDLEGFLARLKGALMLWTTQHPGENAEGGLPDNVIKRPTIQKVEDLIREAGPPKPSTETMEGYDPELVRLAQEGPKALYTKLYGADHKLTQVIGDQTWEEMGGTWQGGLKALLEAKKYGG